MKLWLASYPRSGNTFIRMVLNESFGIKSTSVYPSEDTSIRDKEWLVSRIGYSGALEESDFTCDEWIGVKTHDLPSDDEPAIYIVRDGRAATASYKHMLEDYTDLRPSMEEIIRGEVWPGSWSAHFTAWSPENRKNTLLLKYEDMKTNIQEVCAKISRFLGVSQKQEFSQKFDELHSLEPTLFRSANNDLNIAEIKPCADLFDAKHGRLMRRIGYA
jgi:Sulfotransferase domain